jgi:hypothetical protein
MTRLPALSVSTKLYALFALLAALTLALAVTAVVNARAGTPPWPMIFKPPSRARRTSSTSTA